MKRSFIGGLIGALLATSALGQAITFPPANLAAPGPIGGTTPSTGAFTTLSGSTSVTDGGLSSGNVVCTTTGGLLTVTCSSATPTFSTINGLTLAALTTGFSVAGGTTSKILTVSNTLTLAGTDGTTFTFPSATGTVATYNNAGTFSATQIFATGKFNAMGPNSAGSLFYSYTNPSSPSAGLGSTTAVTYASGTASVVLTIGGTGITSTGSLTMPAASHGWLCDGEDLTTPGVVRTTGSLSTTSVTLTFYNLTGTATAPTSGDLIGLKCMGV